MNQSQQSQEKVPEDPALEVSAFKKLVRNVW